MRLGLGSPGLPAPSGEEDEEFEQGLTLADILLLLFFSQQGESSVAASQESFQVN